MAIYPHEKTAPALAAGTRRRRVGLAVFWLTMGMEMVAQPEQPTIEPRLICDVDQGHGVERLPTGEVRASNLEPIPLRVDLVDRGLEVEPLRVATGADASTVEIEVLEVRGEERSVVAARATQAAVSRQGEHSRMQILLEIPLTESERRAALDDFLAGLEAASRKEGRIEEFRRLSADKDALLVGLQNFMTENRTGEFEVRCTYRSQSPGFWNGEVRAPALAIEVRSDGSAFDRIDLPAGAGPAPGSAKVDPEASG